MSKKRIEAKEWKRKRKHRKQIQRLIVGAVCLVVVAAIGFVGWDMWSRTYVMTFDGQRIATDDMRFFAMFADGFDQREQALNHLTQYLLVSQAARQHNITLTEEERADLIESAAEMVNMFQMFDMPVPNISTERMAELMSLDIFTERLMDLYVADFVIDEDEFEPAFQEFLINHSHEFMDMEFMFLHLEGTERANTALMEFMNTDPSDFEDLILRFMYEDMGFDDIEIPFITLNQMRQENALEPWQLHNLTFLQEGEFSEPIPVGENEFIIFVVDSVHIPTDDEIRTVFREEYELLGRQRAFSDIVDEWYEAADIQINERGVNAV